MNALTKFIFEIKAEPDTQQIKTLKQLIAEFGDQIELGQVLAILTEQEQDRLLNEEMS
jgi:hypothetical protein